MKIKFKKKSLIANLILGMIWTALGIFNILGDDNLHWLDYGYLVIGILYIGHCLYDWTNQYLTIENGTIKKKSSMDSGEK